MSLTLQMGLMLVMVVILSKFASMPRSDTMYPSSFPFRTPKVHFSAQVGKSGIQRGDQIFHSRRLDHNVINVDGDRGLWWLGLVGLPGRVDLVGEASLHTVRYHD